jgi:hypothetical protein
MMFAVMSAETVQILSTVMQWIIAPVAAFVWIIYTKQQTHSTAIAVLQAESVTARQAHDREIKEIRETSRAIMAKLDSIEEALRK